MKLLVFFSLIAIIITVITRYDITRYFSLIYVKSQLDIWLALVEKNFWAFAFVFFVLYVLVTAASIPGALVMTLLAGALFGFIWGVLIVSFASTIGATLSFLAARFFLRKSIVEKFSTQCEKINKGIKKDGAFYLFALRLVPVVPFFVINVVMGLTQMRVVVYMLVSQLGMLVGTCAYVNIGRSLADINNVSGLLSTRVLLSLLVVAIIPIVSKKVLNVIKARRVYKKFTQKKPKKFDANIAIIGAGSGGLIAAYIASVVRASVVLFEKEKMGGDCLNRGCVPSKSLISISKLVTAYKEGKAVGIEYSRPRISFTKIMKNIHETIASIAPHDSVERYEKLGVRCIQEEARISSPWEITTKTQTIKARSIIIASGATPYIPTIPGLREAQPFTSDTIWSLTKQPRSLLVLGGGPIGCELAHAFALLGTSVTLVQKSQQLLHKEDADVAAIAQESLKNAGVIVLAHSTLQTVKKSTTKTSQKYNAMIQTLNEKKPRIVPCDAILVATGRKASVDSLGLNALEIEMNENGSIATDEYLRTSIPNIYAVGDVTGSYQFTHAAGHMAWYASVNALFGSTMKRFAVDYRLIPSVTFLSPEIARVGITENEAREKNIAYEVTKYELKELDRAIAERKVEGFVKILTRPGKDTILGAAVVSERGGEILGEFILAMKHGIGLNKLLGTIHPYPTFIECTKACAGLWKKDHAPQKFLNFVGKILKTRL